MPEPLRDIGHLIEGVVEQDPLDDRFRIRTVLQGKQVVIDPQDLLASYNGKEVRFTLISFETVERLQEILESGGVEGSVMLQDVPGAVVSRKPV